MNAENQPEADGLIDLGFSAAFHFSLTTSSLNLKWFHFVPLVGLTMKVRSFLAMGAFLLPMGFLLAADEKPQTPKAKGAEKAPEKATKDELIGYKTIKDAIKADPKTFRAMPTTTVSVPPFVGVELGTNKAGKPMVEDVLVDSPAAEAGLKKGDIITKIGDAVVNSQLEAREKLRGAIVGEKLPITIQRAEKEQVLNVTAKPLSKPFSATGTQTNRAVLGVQSGDLKSGVGIEITTVTDGGAAAKAGLKAGDHIARIDETKMTQASSLREALSSKKVGDTIELLVKRDDKELKLKAILQGEAAAPGRGGRQTGWDDRLPNAWKRTSYNLAVIGIEYPDVKHNDKIKDADWESSLFSIGRYNEKSATGSTVYGSMNDYFKEISYGTFKVEGKFVGWVEVSKKRTEYSSGSGTATREKTSLLAEAMDKLIAKDKNALKDFDGVFFLYAGDRVQTTRGGLYWPHRASLSHDGKRWPYFIVQEGGARMTNISVFCHEFGHMLGLPDLYARPEVPGMEGVGSWCAMSQQNSNGRPQHFSAWCKEQLGWIKPTVIDPRVKQKLILAPITNSPSECFKVMVKPDGSEYFLLENRKKTGFDKDLGAEGLLVWRVTPGNRTQPVFLEESHGVDGPSGPRMFSGAVPFPSPANTSFTPYTVPSSKAVTGGGLDVSITNIRRLPDGRITFQIGYEYQ